jgi:cellulose synthase/poly-beta-1,6-N-acetylglucosamine synthase-like glycosyltransferase
MSALVLVFWGATAFIVWTYAVFPLLLAVRALRPLPRPSGAGPLPRVSLLIVAHNEAAVIGDKLANLEALDYPRDRLQVIIASDGSDDGTNERVAAHAGATGVSLLALDRIGKNAALNAAAAKADGEILVFSDADSALEPDAMRRLVAAFADPGVGAVAGDFRYHAEGGEGRGERSYWRMDRVWRRLESRAGSATSATGQLHAIRRELFSPVPVGVTDDFYVSTAAIDAGLRLWFEPGAVARGPVTASPDAEFRRKVRLIGRGFASVWARRRLLDPRRTGFYAIQLLSHKVMRRLVGAPLVLLAISSPLLWNEHAIHRLATVAQLVFHGLALAGLSLRRRAVGRAPVFALPLAFDAANAAGLVALVDFMRGEVARDWVPERQGHGAAEVPIPPPTPEEA